MTGYDLTNYELIKFRAKNAMFNWYFYKGLADLHVDAFSKQRK